MTTIYKYQIYCETEGANKFVWSTEDIPPTKCPDDTGHTVTLSSVSIVEQIAENDVVVHQPTTGFYMEEGIPITIPSCTPGDTVTADVNFDINIKLWTAGFNCHSELVGDRFSCIINPGTVLGVVTSPATNGDTVVNVSSTVTDNVHCGMYLQISDAGASPPAFQDTIKIIACDKENYTVTLKGGISTDLSAGSYVFLVYYMAKDIALDAVHFYEFGKKGFSAKEIPEGTLIRMYYVNNDGLAKSLSWKIGYYYGYEC